jgi:hypothetical protein
MKVTIDREPREGEGLALTIFVRGEDHRQFKIDIWSKKDSGEYSIRLDGFGFVRIAITPNLREIIGVLTLLNTKKVVQDMLAIQKLIMESVPEAQVTDELTLAEFVETARLAAVNELLPLASQGSN